MSFDAAFSAIQNASSPSVLTLRDLSTGTPTGAESRRVSFRISDGSYLLNGTSNYWDWPLADDTVDFDLFARDLAVYILTEWLDSGGDAIYQADKYKACDLNSQVGKYNALQKYVVNYAAMRDSNHLTALTELDNAIEGAAGALKISGNLDLGQICLDNATEILNSKDVIF